MATGKITTVNATSVNADTVNATSLTVTGSTSVPTANADNNSKTIANTAFVKTAIANLVNGAPSQLDTLQELSASLGNDANFSATVAKEIGEKLDKAGGTITGPILYDKTPNDGSELPNKAYVDAAIANLVGSAPTTLDTLQELSAALGNDANFSATVANEIGEKVSKSGDTITGPILYDKTPNDGSELPNKSYVDAAINALHDTIKTETGNYVSKSYLGGYTQNTQTYSFLLNRIFNETISNTLVVAQGYVGIAVISKIPSIQRIFGTPDCTITTAPENGKIRVTLTFDRTLYGTCSLFGCIPDVIYVG